MTTHAVQTGHEDLVHDAAIDYYGKRLATASSDCSVRVLSIGSASSPSQLLATLSGHSGPVWRVAWAHPKFGSLLASCSYDGQVIVWKEASGNWTQSHVFTNHSCSVNSIAWAPHELGLCLACGSSDGTISVNTMRPDGSWDTAIISPAHAVGVTAVSWAPTIAPGSLVESGALIQKLASGGFDSVVKVWVLLNGTWKLESPLFFEGHTECVRDIAWAPALGMPKSTIAAALQDGAVIIWTKGSGEDPWEGKLMHEFKTLGKGEDGKEEKLVPMPVWRVSWSLSGNVLSVAAGERNISLWKEAADGQWEQVKKFEH